MEYEIMKDTGIFDLNHRGFAFVHTDTGRIYISEDNMGNACHGDRVEVIIHKTIPTGKWKQGHVQKVINRSKTDFICSCKKNIATPLLPHLPSEIILTNHEEYPIKKDDFAIVEVTQWRSHREKHIGRILKVIGPEETPVFDALLVINMFNIPQDFSSESLFEAGEMSFQLPDEHTRKDLRDLDCFTIDPEDARDFDDAVSICQKDDGSYMLGVHIADVSHYVSENTYLNREALLRGTSVYFTDYTVHMLPERLSTDICSLKENADRLTLSVLMNISKSGEFISYDIFPSVIRNKKRFNYKEVQEILDDQNGPYLRELNLLSQLARLLHDIRHKKGSIDFDIPEPEFELDEKGVPIYMRFKERLWSHQIIEECMLMANKTVARYIRKEKHKMPFIYRVHDIPEYERIQEWFSYMELLGIKVTRFGIPVTPGKFQRAFEEALHQNNSAFIKQTALQVMMKAKYATEPLGHFGLACKDYTHFTSPIRRYPDLIVHRLLKKYLVNHKPDPELEDYLDTVARISSEAEQRALSAQRAYDKIKQMRFLKTKTGEILEGIITNVTAQGLQVELTDYCIEGFVPLYSLKKDYWYFNDKNLTLTGRRTQSRYKIGDIVTVRIVQINIQQLKAEFCLENED